MRSFSLKKHEVFDVSIFPTVSSSKQERSVTPRRVLVVSCAHELSCVRVASIDAMAMEVRADVPVGVRLLQRLPVELSGRSRNFLYRLSVVLLTFVCFASYHMSRLAATAVNDAFYRVKCVSSTSVTSPSPVAPLGPLTSTRASNLDGSAPKLISVGVERREGPLSRLEEDFNCTNRPLIISSSSLFHANVAFMSTYALATFASGYIGDRVSLRRMLFVGTALSGLLTALLGIPFWIGLQRVVYFIIIHALFGITQSTGWPGVVAVMGTWFGKGNHGRGFVVGLWNAQASVGNILGSVIPATLASPSTWGWSFVLTGVITVTVGVIVLAFLVDAPRLVDCDPPRHHTTPATITVQSTDHERSMTSHTASEEQRPLLASPGLESSMPHKNNVPLSQSQQEQPISIWQVWKIPGLMHFTACSFFAKIVFYLFLFWLPNFLKYKAGNVMQSNHAAWLVDAGAVVSGVATSVFIDRGDTQALAVTVMLLLTAPCLWVFPQFGGKSLAHLIGLMLLVATTMSGPLALITTVVSNDLGSHRKVHPNNAMATVAGIINGAVSVGALVGLFVGRSLVTDEIALLSVVTVSCLLAALPLVPLCIAEAKSLRGHCKKDEESLDPVTVQQAWLR